MKPSIRGLRSGYFLPKEILLDEFKVLIDIENIWFVPRCANSNREARFFRVGYVKQNESHAEYSRKGVEAALNAGVHPRQLSFKHTVQMWSEFTAQRPGEFIRASGKQG